MPKPNSERPKTLFIGPTPPPFSGPEIGMKLFLDSPIIQDSLNLRFLATNVRRTNHKKGKVGLAMAFAFVRFFSSLIVALIFFRPRVVYYPITATAVGWLGRDVWCILLSKLFGARVVIHLRASHFRINYDNFNSVTRFLVRFACRRVEFVIVQANYLFKQFEGIVAQEKMVCQYQATELTTPYEVTQVEIGKVLFMGHLTQAKGFCDLLQCIPIVAQQFPDVHFYCAGTLRKGERNVFYNQFSGAKLSYEDPIEAEQRFLEGPYANHYTNLGVIDGNTKAEHVASADIFVLPSYSEGFSRALIEAMSVSKPLVYTPVGAHREALSDNVNGVCVSPGDVEALAAGIVRLLKDRDFRDQVAEKNRKDVVEKYNIDVISNELVATIKLAAS